MKKVILLVTALLMVMTLFVGCAKGPSPDQNVPPSKRPSSIAKFPNIEDNPQVVLKKSTPPSNFPETSRPDTLIVAQNGEPNTLYPLDGDQIPAEIAMRPMYESLVNFNMFTHEYEPRLADSWEMINDVTVRMHLHKGVKCHAGYEMTANDVKWTMKMGQESPVSAFLWKIFDYEKTTVIDKYTIDMVTFEPCGALMMYISDNDVGYIINQKAYEEVTPEYYARHPNGGCGPYKFVDWVAGAQVSYERFEDYWGQKPYYKYLIIRNIPDNVTRSVSLETGEVDIALNIDNASYDSLVDSPLVNVCEFPSYWVIKMCLNNRIAPFNDVRVRRAIRYALDLENMVNIAFNGLALVADSCFPNALDVYEPAPEELAYKYNPEKAKALLKEAGYDENNPLKFELWVANVMEWVQLSEMIHNALTAIGVEVNVTTMDYNMLIDKVSNGDGTYQAELSRFSCAAGDPDRWWKRLYSEGGYQANWCQYKNPEVDRLLKEGRYSTDKEYRDQCYKEIQRIWREDVPWISLASPRMIHGIRSTLDGLEPHHYGISEFRYIHPRNP